jgi:hypothetical protein
MVDAAWDHGASGARYLDRGGDREGTAGAAALQG